MRLFILGLVLSSGFEPSFAADDAEAKAAIQKVEAKFVAAMKKADMAYLKSVLADDFKVIDKDKKTYTKTQWLDVTSKTLKQVKIKTITMDIVTIHTQGNTADLQTKSSMEGTISLNGGKDQTLIDNSTDQETWVKTPNGWKFKKDITLTETATLDGKPIPNQ